MPEHDEHGNRTATPAVDRRRLEEQEALLQRMRRAPEVIHQSNREALNVGERDDEVIQRDTA